MKYAQTFFETVLRFIVFVLVWIGLDTIFHQHTDPRFFVILFIVMVVLEEALVIGTTVWKKKIG